MKKIGRALWEHEGIRARSTRKNGLAVSGNVCSLCPFKVENCVFDGKECSDYIGKNSVFVPAEPGKAEPEVKQVDMNVIPLATVPIITLKVRCTECGEMKVFSARTPSKTVTKELREAALNSKCWFCGKK